MPLAPEDFTPYSTAKPLVGSAPAWLRDPLEQLRVQSYSLYEQIYWNVDQAFKLAQRGEDDQPIYIPSGRVIVETVHRFMATGLHVEVDPTRGTTQDQELATQVWTDLARRERFYSNFNAAKRYGIIRGDWVFLLSGNPDKLPGTRVSIETIDPGSLFPIWSEVEVDTIIGWHIVDQYIDDTGKERIKRRTWRKATGMGGPSPITYEVGVFEVDQWGGPGMKVEEEKPVNDSAVVPVVTLPSPIDDLPIYVVTNFTQPGHLWGSSEMRGLERVIAAVNQGISDEELELVLNGLGVYATDAGAPLDPDTNEEVPWNLGPGRVVEIPSGHFFNRVSGTTTIQPFQDHLKYLHDRLDEASGTPAVAKGRVGVEVAESGVALRLEMGPLLARIAEKEQVVTDVLTNLLFNLPKWLVAYEGTVLSPMLSQGEPGQEQTGTALLPQYGPKLPENDDKRVDQLIKLYEAKAIGVNVLWQELRRMGWDIPEDSELLAGLTETLALGADAFADRMAGEIDGAEQE